MAGKSSYAKASEQRLEYLANAADVYLQSQLAAALAADQRALVFAGFMATAVIALGSGAAVVLTGSTVKHCIGWLAIWEACGLLVAMLLAIWSARPTRWYFPGSHPQSWKSDFEQMKSEKDQMAELLADYDVRIAQNHLTMADNGRLLWNAQCTALGFLILGAAALALIVTK